MQQNNENVVYLKLVVVGDVGVGKTCIIRRYTQNVFTDNYKATIGVDFALKFLQYNEKKLTLQLWDVAGQERFGNLTSVYYRNAVGGLVVCDVTQLMPHNRKPRGDLDSAMKWKSDIDQKAGKIPCFLLINKSDVLENEEQLDSAAIDKFCKENDFIGWLLTSAKANVNIVKAISMLLENIIQKQNTAEKGETVVLKDYLSDDKNVKKRILLLV